MKISELIDHLTDAMENNGDREVLLAYQPNWPLAADISNVYDPAEDDDRADENRGKSVWVEAEDGSVGRRQPGWESGDEHALSDRDSDVLWLAAATGVRYDQNPYAPRAAWSNERY